MAFIVRWPQSPGIKGRNTAPLESLPDLSFPVTRLDYSETFDDLSMSERNGSELWKTAAWSAVPAVGSGEIKGQTG
jgi:hypothetical protein